MTRITNSEQIALALHARLQRLKKNKSAKTEKTTQLDKTVSGANQSKPVLKLPPDMDAETASRAIVSFLLEDAFGSDFAADYRYATMVDRVTSLLRLDPAGQDLLDGAISQFQKDH